MSLGPLIHDLITASHILHFTGVVDAYGHVSVRHPQNSSLYLMSRNEAPALVNSSADIVQYFVNDSSPVDANAPSGFIERYIHSEIYKAYPDIQCVIHSHSEDVLPYAVAGVPLRPVYSMSGFLGNQVPLYDIENFYQPGDPHDLLVRNARLGASLAATLTNGSKLVPGKRLPDFTAVVMRKHGFTTYYTDLHTAVFRAVYTAANARVQTNSAMLRSAFGTAVNGAQASWSGASFTNPFEPLTSQQANDSYITINGTTARPWDLWTKQVESDPFYTNNA